MAAIEQQERNWWMWWMWKRFGVSQTELARRYGMSQTRARYIVLHMERRMAVEATV